MEKTIQSDSIAATVELGEKIGRQLRGGEVLELIGDVGGGKTTLVRGIAKGIDSSDQVMSPTFTISRIYQGRNVDVHHFDFYRLDEPGVIAAELTESLEDEHVAVVIEWSDIVTGVLPEERLRIELSAPGEVERKITVRGSDRYLRLMESIA